MAGTAVLGESLVGADIEYGCSFDRLQVADSLARSRKPDHSFVVVFRRTLLRSLAGCSFVNYSSLFGLLRNTQRSREINWFEVKPLPKEDAKSSPEARRSAKVYKVATLLVLLRILYAVLATISYSLVILCWLSNYLISLRF